MNLIHYDAGDFSSMKIILLMLGLALSLTGCSGRSPDGKPASAAGDEHAASEIVVRPATAKDLGITVVEVRRKSLQTNLVIPARLLPNQDREAIVGSLVQGRVQRVRVNAGSQVREGEELMLIEGLEIGEIKAAFIKAKAHLRYAEANALRQRVLHEQNIGSEKTLLEAEAEFQKARAEFTAEDRKIHSVGLSDSDVERFVSNDGDSSSSHVGGLLPVRSPLSGVVAERNVVQGQLVEATTNAFRIIDTGVLWADGQMHERDLGENPAGRSATLTVTALPGRTFKGDIIFVSPVIDAQTRTVTVRAAIPNTGGLLKPNMFGELHVTAGPERHVLSVPENALVRDNGSAFVFIGINDTLFVRRTVSLGQAVNGDVEVTDGIKEGERIVANGSFLLKSELSKEVFGEGE